MQWRVPWPGERVEVVATPPNLAVLAAHRATSLPLLAAIVPLLPPRTRNVTLPKAAKPLEFGGRAEDAPEAKSKSGKNGNVDHPSQLCHAARLPSACLLLDAPGATAYTGETEPTREVCPGNAPGLPSAFRPGNLIIHRQ
jgi:hypothetical protein